MENVARPAHSRPAPRIRVSDHEQMIPKILLRAMAGLVIAVTALVAFAVLSDRPHEAAVHTAPVAKTMQINIQKDGDGAILVTDMNGGLLGSSARDKAGFIAVVHSALAYERKMHGIDSEDPVTLIRFADGRIGLRDDATGWKIHLNGFGQDNTRAWTAILAD
ncbi:photosynthetic complex assembly protein PuhC [Oceanibium sediminis]|uniref:photosynthetic complex assembly protein PuhC n=1 Tax=Oceanibium sediminis TaxID=2026339 RepID=UPI000DD40049|nr:photosynthetic complex assembly protein PuhC [Oceanibium sediminis]